MHTRTAVLNTKELEDLEVARQHEFKFFCVFVLRFSKLMEGPFQSESKQSNLSDVTDKATTVHLCHKKLVQKAYKEPCGPIHTN